MVITFHGKNCFKLQSGNFNLITDPLNERMKPDITLKTLVNTAEIEGISTDKKKILDSAGEYEIDNVQIKGLQINEESTEKFIKIIFEVGLENFRICFLGHLSDGLNSAVAEELGNIDILFLPLGKPFLSIEKGGRIVKEIEPRLVIPNFFNAQDKKIEKDFLKEMGQKVEAINKLTIKQKDLPIQGTKIIILNQV